MRVALSGRFSLFVWVALLGASACSDPSEPVATRATEPREHAGAIRRLPPGFFELWPGGPVLADKGRARELAVSFIRRRADATARQAGELSQPAFAVVQASLAEILEGESGSPSEVNDVNVAGTVVGIAEGPFLGRNPATWFPGSVSPTLLPVVPAWEAPRPAAINAAGQIVGDAQVLLEDGGRFSRVILWGLEGALITLPPLPGREFADYAAADIAPNGDILGYPISPFDPNGIPIVVWQGGVPTDVAAPGDNALPLAINASGIILAATGTGPEIRRADGTWVHLPTPFEPTSTFATGLADDGTIVGGAVTEDGFQIIRWSPDGTPTVLPPPSPGQNGFASAINNQGTILLTVFDPGSVHPLAYVLDEGDYSPLPSVPPDITGVTWDLDLGALSDANIAVGNWRGVFTGHAFGTRWMLTFENAAPIVAGGGPYSGTEGTPLGFAGSAFDPTPTGSLTATWTFGDGGSASGLTPSHTYADNGSYTATLSVTDGEFTATSSTLVSVTNAAPVVTVPSADTATAGVSYTLGAGFGDAGAADGPWTYVINWGDGATTQATQAASGPIPASRLYKQAGNFTIQVTVRDKDGTAGSASYPLIVLKRNGRPRP